MEALPRLPMLAFELKHSPEYIEFGPTLKQYIKDHYGEDPALYNKACTDLEQLRQAAIQVSRDFMGCTTLKKYYAQLQYLQGRFPMGEGEEAAIAFTWEDVQTGRDHVISDIKFEQACILYNIGSLHSLLGVLDTRHNAEGMKVSCTHFQCAGWAFEHLRDNFGSSSMSTDMSYELLSFHIILMLAQAQECILEKSMIDNRKNNITAKVAAQVVEFYKDASRLIDLADQKQQINSRMHKEWGRRLLMKSSFYQCITYYFLGRQSEESEKPGECLAYYTAAKDELARATQLAKNEVSEVMDCLHFAKDVVMGKYDSAKKDNDFVYHDKVPAIDTLPEVKGASLVKGIPFNPADKDISGADIFEKLVPMEAHEASSVYSEEKAKLSRSVVSDIEQKNMELEQFLSSLQLDMDQLMPKTDLLPENLMEKCAAMSVRTNAIKELTDSMACVSGFATEVQLNIDEIQQLVEEDSEKTEQFEKQYGKKNPSSVLPRLLEELSEFRKHHEEGSQLNTTLHKAMNTHTNNLKTLTLPPVEIQSLLPPSQPKLGPENENVVSEIRRLMQKVNEMREQRKALLEQFREQILRDDITSVLVTQDTSDKDSVFAQQLKKHDQTVGYIRQNLTAQDNILRLLTDTNAKFATIRQAYNEASAKREKMVQDLILSYEKYEELLAKSKKGEEYYKKLHENITRTLERCRSECKVRQEEQDMLLAKFAPKAPAPSRPLAPKPGSSNAGTPSSIPPTPELGTTPGFPPAPSGPDPLSMPSGQFQSLPPSFEGPKLKDYLPFMKPRSFGPKSSAAGTPPDPAMAPPSLPPDMPQLDSGDYSSGQRYPGLDPSLASVLPATIAQYLASVSAASSSAAGARHSPSPSSSPQHKGSPRHTPSPLASAGPSASSVAFPGAQSIGGPALPTRYPSPAPGDTPQAYPPTIPQQNVPPSHVQPNISLHSSQPPAGQLQQFPPQPANGATTSGQQQYQPYQHYGYIPGLGHPQQYASTSRQDNTSIVSAVSKPIFSPGQETINQAPVHLPHHIPQQLPQQVPQQPFGASQPHPQQNQSQQPSLPQQPQVGQLPPSAGQQYGHVASTLPSQVQYGQSQPAPSSASAQPAPGHGQPQQWPQNQYPGQMQPGQNQFPQVQGQMPQIQGQMHPGQVQNQYSQQAMAGGYTSSQKQPISTVLPAQGYGAGGYGMPSQGQPQGPHPANVQQHPPQQQPSSQPMSQQPVGPHPGQPKTVGYAGAMPQQMGGATPQGNVGGSQQMGGVGSISQQPIAPNQNNSTQLGQTNTQARQFRFPTTSVGYNYNMDPKKTPFTANFAYPNEQLYQQVARTSYHPTQQYQGGYQHSVERSYQNAQTYGSFTSKAVVYGQSGQPISTQSQGFNTQTVFSQSRDQAGQFSTPSSQVPGPQMPNQMTGPNMQGQFQGSQLPVENQRPQPQGYAQGPHMPGQGPQVLGQGSQMQNQVQDPQMQGQDMQLQGPGLRPQMQGPVQGPQLQGQNQIPGNHFQPIPQGQQSQLSNIPQVHQQFPRTVNPQQQQQMGIHRPPQQPLPSQPLPQQQQQSYPQPLQQQPPAGFQQQPQGVMMPTQQANFKPGPPQLGPQQQYQQQQLPHQQHQLQQQQQAQPQQIMRPYGPQQHLPSQTSGQQAPTPQGARMPPPNLTNMQIPLQPTNVGGAVQLSTPSQAGPRAGSQVSVNVPPTPTSPIESKRSVSRQSSSLDDILSSSPDGVQDITITPQVLTDQERQLQKEEAMKNQAIVPATEPYTTQAAMNKLLADVEAFGKFVDELSVTILGVSRLDTVWKSLLDSQDAAVKKLSMAIARCYPMKNRDPDIMPYDETRVVLTTTKDDYINASWLNDLAPSCPKFITTQAPMPLTMGEFCSMVYEQGSEVLVQITSEYETGKKFPVYYPTEKDKPVEQGVMLLSLQSVKFRQHWVERIVYLKNTQTKQARTVVHLQFKNWPVSGFPEDVSNIVHFISEVHSFYMQQRSLTKPIIVHCGSGIGRTGVFILVYTAMQEIIHGNGMIDLPGMARRMLLKRRGILHKKEQLKCCYEAVLCFAEEYLQKRGVLVKNPHFCTSKKNLAKGSPKHHGNSIPASDDIVLGTVDLQTIRENVGRLHVHSSQSEDKRSDSPGSIDQSLSKKSLESLSSISNSSLPDVVQQPSDSQTLSEMDRIGGVSSRRGSNSSSLGAHIPPAGSSPASISSGPQSSTGPIDSAFGSTKPMLNQVGSFNVPSPVQPSGGIVTASAIPAPLAQLQDPATFTMGSPDAKKKNKITKSNFNQAVGSIHSTSSDPQDPLGSLDPMWSMGKNK